MSYTYAAGFILFTMIAFVAGGFLEWDAASKLRKRNNFLEADNADLEKALLLSYQENEAMREILLARTSPRSEK